MFGQPRQPALRFDQCCPVERGIDVQVTGKDGSLPPGHPPVDLRLRPALRAQSRFRPGSELDLHPGTAGVPAQLYQQARGLHADLRVRRERRLAQGPQRNASQPIDRFIGLAAGGELLVVLGYADQGGVGMIRAALDTGAFDRFALGDGMFSDSLLEAIGDDLNGTVGEVPWSEGEGADAFIAAANAGGVDPDGSFRRESYDAAALIALAIQKAGATDGASIAANMLAVANAPGEKILPGELGKALKILADGGDVDYVGATNVELIGPGEAAGYYREYEVIGGAYETVRFH